MHCHVGVVLPIMAPSGRTFFQLCQNKECVQAGQFGTFGMEMSESVDLLTMTGLGEWRVNSTTHLIAETEVTNVLIKEGWSPEDPLVARLSYGVLKDVPQPCVIIKELQDDNVYVPIIVNLHPAEKIDNYGDLIHPYKDAISIVSSVNLS